MKEDFVEGIGMKDVLILDTKIDGTAADLLLAHLYGEDLVVGERHFLDNNDIPVAVKERPRLVKDELGCQVDGLRVCCLSRLLVRQLHPQLVNIKFDVRAVVYREVEEEVVSDTIHVIQSHRHAVFLRGGITVTGR